MVPLNASSTKRELSAHLAVLWAVGSYRAALAQLHHTLYDPFTRSAFPTPNLGNAYETRTTAQEIAVRIGVWGTVEWSAAIEASPFALLLALDSRCADTTPTLN